MIIRGRGAAVGDNIAENKNHHSDNFGENENHHGDNIALLRTRTHTLSSHRGGSGDTALCRFCKLNLSTNYILRFSISNSGGFPAPQEELFERIQNVE